MCGYSTLSGEIENWPPKMKMANILSEGGISVLIGKYSIRIEGCDDFVFREYGGDLGEPVITAADVSIARLCKLSRKVSEALANNKIRHRFEIYDETEELAEYYHYEWGLD